LLVVAKEEQERRERWEKENARRAYLAEGGTESKLHEEMRRRRVMEAERAAREGQPARGVGRI
jgi:hypothetical protein